MRGRLLHVWEGPVALSDAVHRVMISLGWGGSVAGAQWLRRVLAASKSTLSRCWFRARVRGSLP